MADLIHRLSNDELVSWYNGSQSDEMLNILLTEMILRGLV